MPPEYATWQRFDRIAYQLDESLSCTLLARPEELLKALRRPMAHGTQPKMIR
jgi:hypothetical protein